jgi:serine O-acetyltransferase
MHHPTRPHHAQVHEDLYGAFGIEASRIVARSYSEQAPKKGLLSRLREDIEAIRDRDPAARSAWEVLTCYPGLHALWLHRIAHWCWTHSLRWVGRFVSHLGRFLTGIEIHPGATKGAKRHPTLGRGVIVGAGAQVLGGFTVGDGARVGSNAVVVKEVPAGATAVGNPARILHKEVDALRESTANKLGFSAYGIGASGDDPLIKALHGLIDHAAAQQREIEALKDALRRQGIEVDERQVPAAAVDPKQLNRLVEE